MDLKTPAKSHAHLLSYLLLPWCIACCWWLTSCNNTQYLQRNEYLYRGATIDLERQHLDRPTAKALNNQLALIPRPTPNSGGFGTFKLWIYNTTRYAAADTNGLFQDDRLRRLNRLVFMPPIDTTIRKTRMWLYKRFAKPPVLLDTVAVQRSTKALQSVLFDKGYFFNQVSPTITQKKQQAWVTYHVSVQSPFTIGKVQFNADTTRQIDRKLQRLFTQSELQSGQQFEAAKLQTVVNNMVNYLKNNGYYFFSSQYLSFKLDSLHATRTVDVYLNVKTPSNQDDHYAYRLNEVYLMTNYTTDNAQLCCPDTLLYDDYRIVYNKELYCQPKVLTNYLALRKGSLYSAQKTQDIQVHLSELGVYKFINIRYDTIAHHQLNCRIYLTPAKQMQVSFDTEINNLIAPGSSDRSLLGTSLSTTYKNKNLLGGAESFTASLSGGVGLNLLGSGGSNDAQLLQGNEDGLIQSILVNAKTQVSIPQFLVPFRLNRVSRKYRPRTIVTGEINYSQRVGFATFGGAGFSVGYDWRESSKKRHQLRPLSLSLLNVISTAAAYDSIVLRNEFIKRSFQSSVIAGANYTYNYSTQKIGSLNSFWSFRGYLETAGNTLRAVDLMVRPNQTMRLLGTPYAQYAIAESEIKSYRIFSKDAALVARGFAGVGLPYGNSTELPYTKQYFIGGANSVRAFAIREVGPGSLASAVNDTTVIKYDRTGNIRLEANLEYRFPLWYYLKGAIFVDAGNVWDIGEKENRPNGAFRPATVLRDMAVGAGVGLRLDITYFVFRFDLAVPLRDPRSPFVQPRPFPMRSVLAVGYPF